VPEYRRSTLSAGSGNARQDAADLPAAEHAIHRAFQWSRALLLAERQSYTKEPVKLCLRSKYARAPFVITIVQVLHVGGLAARLAASP